MSKGKNTSDVQIQGLKETISVLCQIKKFMLFHSTLGGEDKPFPRTGLTEMLFYGFKVKHYGEKMNTALFVSSVIVSNRHKGILVLSPYGKTINTFCSWVLCQNTISHMPFTLKHKRKGVVLVK